MTTNALPNPDNIVRAVLDNGLTVLVRENHASPVVVLEGSLRAGALYDPAAQLGLSSFTASMLTRGSAQYSYDLFNETIESVGASLSVSGDTDAANLGLTCLSEDFASLLHVLADALRRPVFPQPQFDILKQQKLVHLQERDQETAAIANLRFYEAVYGGHLLGRPVSGFIETVDAIRRDDLAAFHMARYTPRGGVIAISGNVRAMEVIDLLARILSDWRGALPECNLPPVAPLLDARRLEFILEDKVQSDIVMGCQAVARCHPDFDAVRVANAILGVFGMMGRLGEVVREQQGLAYYAYSSQDASADAGVWLAAAGVNPADVEQAIDSMMAEFIRLGAEPVSAEELADSKAYLTGVLPLTLETNEGVAATLLNMEWYGLGLDYLLRYRNLIDKITVEDVQRVAQTYLRPDRCIVVVAGPESPGEE
jgi:zinc protease